MKWAKIDWITFEQEKPKEVVDTQIIDHNQADNSGLPTILTVDDSPTAQGVIKLTLGNKYNIVFASNAIDGIKILNKQNIDLMLLDVNMPGIDGLQMCKTIRSMPKFKDLPIIMLTAQNTRVDKIKGQIAGSNHYLNKPFAEKELISIVDRYLDQVENTKPEVVTVK